MVGMTVTAITIEADEAPQIYTSGDYRYLQTEKDEAILHVYSGSASDLLIPDQLDGHTVIGIGCTLLMGIKLYSMVFKNNEELTSVTIPDSVLFINDYAFEGCTGLTIVIIPASVAIIGEEAFTGCPNLTFTVVEGSYAEQYAKEYGIPYVLTAE